MTRTVTSRNYSPGSRTFDFPTALEKRFTSCSIAFTRENWPGTNTETICTVTAERSDDNGQTWEEIGSAQFPGGELIHPRTGQVVGQSSIAFSFGGEVRTGDIRVRAVNTMALRTAVTLEVQ